MSDRRERNVGGARRLGSGEDIRSTLWPLPYAPTESAPHHFHPYVHLVNVRNEFLDAVRADIPQASYVNSLTNALSFDEPKLSVSRGPNDTPPCVPLAPASFADGMPRPDAAKATGSVLAEGASVHVDETAFLGKPPQYQVIDEFDPKILEELDKAFNLGLVEAFSGPESVSGRMGIEQPSLTDFCQAPVAEDTQDEKRPEKGLGANLELTRTGEEGYNGPGVWGALSPNFSSDMDTPGSSVWGYPPSMVYSTFSAPSVFPNALETPREFGSGVYSPVVGGHGHALRPFDAPSMEKALPAKISGHPADLSPFLDSITTWRLDVHQPNPLYESLALQPSGIALTKRKANEDESAFHSKKARRLESSGRASVNESLLYAHESELVRQPHTARTRIVEGDMPFVIETTALVRSPRRRPDRLRCPQGDCGQDIENSQRRIKNHVELKCRSVQVVSLREWNVSKAGASPGIKCDECHRGYKTLANWEKHLRTVHGGWGMHKCNVCDLIYAIFLLKPRTRGTNMRQFVCIDKASAYFFSQVDKKDEVLATLRSM